MLDFFQMLNYKRLTFIFVFLTVLLLASDTQMERQLRKNLLSLFDIVVEEGSQVSDSAPSSFIEAAENTRVSTYNFLNKNSANLDSKADNSKGLISLLLTISAYVLFLLKFIAKYVITFYPFIVLIVYFFLTSRFFKRDEFGYDNF